MKAEHISIALKLHHIPNIGPKTVRLLSDIGIHSPADLAGKDSVQLYDKICQVTRHSHDLRLLDILMSAEDFIRGNRPRHWSEFSEQRRLLLSAKKSTSKSESPGQNANDKRQV